MLFKAMKSWMFHIIEPSPGSPVLKCQDVNGLILGGYFDILHPSVWEKFGKQKLGVITLELEKYG